MSCILVKPTLDHLPGYKDALERGWSPDNVLPEKTARVHLLKIDQDPAGFVAALTDTEAKGPPIMMPDGSVRTRLPGYILWVIEDDGDGDFCGSFGFRWQNGTSALPDYCLGHIGYSIVPWKRRRGYATEGLRQLLLQARQRDLDYVELTTDPENIPSQKVILANGGVQVGGLRNRIDALGGDDELLFRIHFAKSGV